MLKNYEEIKQKIKSTSIKKVAVACPDDEEVLEAVKQAHDEGLMFGILVGDQKRINEVALKHDISLEGFEIINVIDHYNAALKCCELVRSGKANVVMKGLLDTSKFMKAILHKEKGLNSGNLVSHVAVFEIENYNKLLFITDAAINIAPTVVQKVKMIENSVHFAHSFNIGEPLVACCCAVEKVTASMPATIEAATLAKMSDRGQIKGCIVDGPFGLDNAISEESARIKKIKSPVAGKADVILCHDIEAANYLYKSLMFFGNHKGGAVVLGASAPIVLTSRADSHETKYLSIILAVVN